MKFSITEQLESLIGKTFISSSFGDYDEELEDLEDWGLQAGEMAAWTIEGTQMPASHFDYRGKVIDNIELTTDSDRDAIIAIHFEGCDEWFVFYPSCELEVR